MGKEYQKFLQKNINLAPLGIERRDGNSPYFCTPKGAKMIGWAGVDGIYFCFIRSFGEMVFSVSPMNTAPHLVHLLARNFTDFLRMLLAVGSSEALEHVWRWDEAQFDAYLEENRPTEEQQTVLAQLSEQMELAPMQNPWQYLGELQAEFDYSKIPYTEDYYDLDMNPDAPQKSPAWEVYFEGNLWGNKKRHRPGKELQLDTNFDWAGHHWVIPAVYVCAKGLIVDFCMRVEPNDIRSLTEKWDLNIETESERQFTREQQIQLDVDNPLALDFRSALILNGKKLQNTNSCVIPYNPCQPNGCIPDGEAKAAVEHYRLDSAMGWTIYRSAYPWATKRKPKIKVLSVKMIQQNKSVPGPRFSVNAPGDTIQFCYRGADYTFTVQEYEAQTLDMRHMAQPDMEYPTHYNAMSYTIAPEPPDGVMAIVDCAESDRPRQKQTSPNVPTAINDVVVGIIVGADGSVATIQGQSKKQENLRVTCSALHFAPTDEVEWCMVFHEKQFEDLTLDVNLPKELKSM